MIELLESMGGETDGNQQIAVRGNWRTKISESPLHHPKNPPIAVSPSKRGFFGRLRRGLAIPQ